mmetsp:Transcript_9638/g.41459  ORF Transcript_9638/g.41459 Transcript_9638/m.41459 type:complete len:92 (+) Transcript_9638:1540-1815(+)
MDGAIAVKSLLMTTLQVVDADTVAFWFLFAIIAQKHPAISNAQTVRRWFRNRQRQDENEKRSGPQPQLTRWRTARNGYYHLNLYSYITSFT